MGISTKSLGSKGNHDSKSPAHPNATEQTSAPPEGTSFIYTIRFWQVLFLGQILSLCIVGSNTLSGLLSAHGTSIPAFQLIFNYVLLGTVYTSYTLYKYGFRGYLNMVWKHGWKYLILSFLDVEGNYFVVLGFRYTTILSAQLINCWAIVIVVVISFSVLKVRYRWTQVLGILVCCGGMALLLVSDHIHNGSKFSGGVSNELKGDLFMFVGATLYGLTNVAEEFLVSKRPLYEVIGQLGFWGVLINGAQAAIFDRNQFSKSVWDSKTGGYVAGFTLCLFTFYSLAPIMFRMASAAFFNISLLTGNFWGLLIALKVFGATIYYLYGVAFTLVMIGLVIYYCMHNFLGEATKPWLGEEQQEGVEGIGTARAELAKAYPNSSGRQADLEANGEESDASKRV